MPAQENDLGNPDRPALHPHPVHCGDMDKASLRGGMGVYFNTTMDGYNIAGHL